MSTQTDSALRELLTRFNDYADLTDLTDNAEAFARALIAECCTDLVIVPRGELSEIAEQHQHSRMHGAWVDCNKATSDRAAADGLEVRIVYLPATPEK